jgi:hypothetical protein
MIKCKNCEHKSYSQAKRHRCEYYNSKIKGNIKECCKFREKLNYGRLYNIFINNDWTSRF